MVYEDTSRAQTRLTFEYGVSPKSKSVCLAIHPDLE